MIAPKVPSTCCVFTVAFLTGCDAAQLSTSSEQESKTVPWPATAGPATKVVSASQALAPPAFELYSTLAGKMARMEELLNAIDRFLDEPGFEERLLADAEELRQLLRGSRGLYPGGLSEEEQAQFDETIDRTDVTSGKLLEALKASHRELAREALKELEAERQAAHVRFSH